MVGCDSPRQARRRISLPLNGFTWNDFRWISLDLLQSFEI